MTASACGERGNARIEQGRVGRDIAPLAERLGFLRYAISIGEGSSILGQILLDLEEQTLKLIDPEDDPRSPYLFPEEEDKRALLRRLRATVERYRDRAGSGIAVSPVELADELEGLIFGKAARPASSASLPAEYRRSAGTVTPRNAR
jgi:hypothetical protein